MAYCTSTEVGNLNPKRTYGAATTPTSTQVSALIDQVAVEIDAVLEAHGYTVPVTSPTNLVAFLKYVNAYGAAYLAEAGMFPETAEPGETAHWQMLKKVYDNYLKMLMEGNIPASLGIAEESANAASYYTQMDDQDDFPDPVFRKRPEDKEF